MAGRKGRPQVGSSLRPSGGSGSRSGSPSSTAGSGASFGAAASRGRGGGKPDLPDYTRPALAPSLLAAIVLLACVALLDAPAFVAVRWGITVLALIVLVFALRGRTWWAIAVTAAVAVCWNPLVTVPIPGQVWAALQIVAAAVFIVVGIAVKVPRSAHDTPAR
ncbi:DUF6804 family protein [Microbacterium sp. M1A1_1b]|uniref:DUF6804 family protein n=1 Tax=Curtobacterium sp. VKM Ac-2922 TaxID=2929475 RepID=UPI001FB2F7B6|nr:DUF6804 family protein [Curtobacterium sp. VKM Ac-2922]MCJ1714848.1 hypothetical protein [Curtobacterium sp. VKM Ac-2922]